MRPTPAETAAAVGRLLDGWAQDEALTLHMRWQLRRASSVLAQTDWEDASASLGASNARLSMLVNTSINWVEGLGESQAEAYSPALEIMREAVAEPDECAPDFSLFQRHNDVNVKLRAAVGSFLASLEADEREGFQARQRDGLAQVFELLDEL